MLAEIKIRTGVPDYFQSNNCINSFYSRFRIPFVFQVKIDSKTFEVNIDASQFSPEELVVKIHGDHLIISGKHEKRPDEHGFISREFSREFFIPEVIPVK